MSCPLCGGRISRITILSPQYRDGVANCVECCWTDTCGIGARR